MDLARCILDLIQNRALWNLPWDLPYENAPVSVCQMILELKRIKIIVKPVSTEELNLPAKRPAYSVLENFMLDMVRLDRFRRWEEALAEYLRGE